MQSSLEWFTLALDVADRLSAVPGAASRASGVVHKLGSRLDGTDFERLAPKEQAARLRDALFVPGGLVAETEPSLAGLLPTALGHRPAGPLVLALALATIAEQAGGAVEWVDFPGLPLLRLVDRRPVAHVDRSALLDPRSGFELNRDDLHLVAEETTGHPDFDPGRLAAVAPRHMARKWLLLIRELLRAESNKGPLLVVLTSLATLGGPEASPVYRDRARLFARLGAPRSAVADYERYLAGPVSADRKEVERELSLLRPLADARCPN